MTVLVLIQAYPATTVNGSSVARRNAIKTQIVLDVLQHEHSTEAHECIERIFNEGYFLAQFKGSERHGKQCSAIKDESESDSLNTRRSCLLEQYWFIHVRMFAPPNMHCIWFYEQNSGV